MPPSPSLAHDPGGSRRIPLPADTEGSGQFSACGRYRYSLRRQWNHTVMSPRMILFAMMNPSTADASVDDPTVAKCGRLARRLGFHGMWVGNACAYRATDKAALLGVDDPVGPDNLIHLHLMAHLSEMVVVAHGKLPGKLQGHADAMCAKLLAAGKPLHVLRLTKDGTPMHPLYIPDAVDPVVWRNPGGTAA